MLRLLLAFCRHLCTDLSNSQQLSEYNRASAKSTKNSRHFGLYDDCTILGRGERPGWRKRIRNITSSRTDTRRQRDRAAAHEAIDTQPLAPEKTGRKAVGGTGGQCCGPPKGRNLQGQKREIDRGEA